MTLHQCLAHARHAAEVAVNLKRWMRIEQVVQSRFGNQRLHVLAHLVAVTEPRPKADDPRAAPPRMPATMRETPFDRRARGARERGRAAHGDLITRKQREELRDMTMAGFRLVVGFRPLLNLTVLADRRRRAGEDRRQRL